MGIVVIGATFVDIKGFPLERYIPTGRNAGRLEYVHGGVARNVVEDMANVGLRPTYLGIVDDTPLGSEVVRRLAERGVDVGHVMTRPGGMGTWLAVFNDYGDVAGSVSQRPDMLPLLELLETEGDAIFAGADSVVIEVDLDRAIVERALELAQRHGRRIYGIVANISLVRPNRDLLPRFSCFICNRQEVGHLFQEDCVRKSAAEMEEFLGERVEELGIPSMVVTMGSLGAAYAGCDGTRGFCKPPRRIKADDTTGAGDAFCAGVSLALTYGKSMEEAITIGSILGASVLNSLENVCARFDAAELGLVL